jgi:glc operon protein GlcG
MDTVSALKLTKQGATKALNAAFEAAKTCGRGVGVAVVDDGGNLMLFDRSDDAELISITVAQAKARAAAMTRFPTGKKSGAGNERTDHHALAITLAAGTDRFVTMEGGVPIKVDGQVVGGVAVSGAGHKDGDIAKAAAAVLGVMDTVSVLKLTRQGAYKVLNATFEAAKTYGRGVGVAVVDDGGSLMLFDRTDDAELTTITVAQAKARAAAMTRFPTGKKSAAGNERTDHHALAITLAAGTDRFVTMEGGVPIKVKGQVIGGVAVSGGGHKDGDIAKAGAAVLDV